MANPLQYSCLKNSMDCCLRSLVGDSPWSRKESDTTECLGWENSLVKEMATHPTILAWEIPWTEKPGRLWSMGWQKNQTRLRD